MAKKLVTRISQRSDTTAGWAAANPILFPGEIGIESDTARVKHGDGTSTWNQLPYWTGANKIYTATDGIAINNNVIAAILLFDVINIEQ